MRGIWCEAYSVLQRLDDGGGTGLPLYEEVVCGHQGIEPAASDNGQDGNSIGNESPIGDDQSDGDVILLEDAANRDHPRYEEHNAHCETSCAETSTSGTGV